MNCDEYLPLISGHLDGANSEFEERRLQEHLQACEDCRALLAIMEQNDALLKGSAAEPPADLTERIMQQVRKEKRSAPSRKKRWLPIAASGLAAAALLALVVWGNVPFVSVSRDALSADAAKTIETAAPAETVNENAYGSLARASDLTEAPAAPTEPFLTQSFVPSYAIEELEPDDQAPKAYAGFVPDFPDYQFDSNTAIETSGISVGSLDAPTEPGDKRTPLYYTHASAMLIVWGANHMDALKEYEPEDLNEYAPLNARLAPSLYERYQAVLPLLRDFDRISADDGFGITVYTVPYETLMAAFNECVGVYENAIYYPAAFTAPEECSVVLVSLSE